MELSKDIVNFVEKQSVAVAATFSSQGRIHCSIKEVIAAKEEGKVFLMDLYQNRTFNNLEKDPRISVTVLNEHEFKGYTLQGKAKIVLREDIEDNVVQERENKIIKRISNRIIQSIKADHKSKAHFEAELPPNPRYLIEVDVEEVIDLSPPRFRSNKT